MTGGNRPIAGSAVIVLTTLVFSLLLAALWKGPEYFAAFSLARMSVTFCLVGAAFYSVLKYRGTRDMIFSVFVVTLAHLLVFKVTKPHYFIEFFLYYAALGASVLIYYRAAVSRMARIRAGKFIVLAILITIIYSAVTMIASLFLAGRSLSQSLTGILTVISPAGAVLGLGLEAGEFLISKLFQRPLER